MAGEIPYCECKYLKEKNIWVKKIQNQVKKLIQGFFMSNMSQKLNINFQFCGDDLKKLLAYCSQMNSEVEISGFSRKLRTYFSNGGQLNQDYMKMLAKMFRQTIQLYLVRVEHATEWYFLYKNPEGDLGIADGNFEFAKRDKNLQTLFKKSKNNSFEIERNSLLLSRIAYSANNLKSIEFVSKSFLYHLFDQTLKDAQTTKKVNSKILFKHYLAKGEKNAKHRTSDLEEENDSLINQVVKFEENSYKTYEKIKEQLTKINFLTVISKFFKLLSLEFQMMDPNPSEQIIIDMLRDDLKYVYNEDIVQITLPSFYSDFDPLQCFEKRLLHKKYFSKVTITSNKREVAKTSALYRLVKFREIDFDYFRIKDFHMSSARKNSCNLLLTRLRRTRREPRHRRLEHRRDQQTA